MEEEDDEDLSELDADGTNGILASVQKDIRTLRFMAKQKEKEWNYILKLMKVKEELQAKLMRRREVLKITTASASASSASPSALLGVGRNKHLPSAAQLHAVAQQHLAGQQGSSQASLQSFINQSLTAIMNNSTSKSSGAAKNSPGSFSGSVGQQQQQQATNKMLQNRQRPILPKPSMQLHPEVQQLWGQQLNHQSVADSGLVLDDSRHRQQSNQGTINVQSLIADYRAKHPEEIPTRGRRIRQPSRICNDPNSSSSPPPASQTASSDGAGVSFKVMTGLPGTCRRVHTCPLKINLSCVSLLSATLHPSFFPSHKALPSIPRKFCYFSPLLFRGVLC